MFQGPIGLVFKFNRKMTSLSVHELIRSAPDGCFESGDYEMWRTHNRVVFQISRDYALWDIIENGNSFNPVARTTTTADGTSTSTIPGPITTEEKVQKKNDVKARMPFLGGENISQEDLNLKFLRILPSEWNNSWCSGSEQTRFDSNEL
ncbi:hypothetical protein Tco_0668997 [Tanacetum coccineum]